MSALSTVSQPIEKKIYDNLLQKYKKCSDKS